MATRRFSRTSAPRPARKLIWARRFITAPLALPALSVVLIPLLADFVTAYGADVLGSTVKRIRMNLTLQSSSNGQGIRAVHGIGVFPSASTSGVISPSGQPHLDWMYWKAFELQMAASATEQAVTNPPMEIDVRAQRRMPELGQELFYVLSNTHATQGVNYSYGASVLLALP